MTFIMSDCEEFQWLIGPITMMLALLASNVSKGVPSAKRRPAARRLQNMGWTPDGQLWVTTRGGDVLISPEAGVSDKFEDKRIGSRGFGILDVG
jgi:photosystem II stability/assembly factor-like uncharacterized protein